MFKNLVGVADVNFEKVNGRTLRNYKADLIVTIGRKSRLFTIECLV